MPRISPLAKAASTLAACAEAVSEANGLSSGGLALSRMKNYSGFGEGVCTCARCMRRAGPIREDVENKLVQITYALANVYDDSPDLEVRVTDEHRARAEEMMACVESGDVNHLREAFLEIEEQESEGLLEGGTATEIATYLIISAAQVGQPEVIRLLAEWDADMEEADSIRRGRPLMHAANNGHTAAVKALVDCGADPEATDDNGYTALMVAVFSDRSSAAEALVDGGACVDTQDRAGRTALSYAAMYGSTDCIYLLAARGADVAHIDHDGNTPLELAEGSGRQSAVDALKKLQLRLKMQEKRKVKANKGRSGCADLNAAELKAKELEAARAAAELLEQLAKEEEAAKAAKAPKKKKKGKSKAAAGDGPASESAEHSQDAADLVAQAADDAQQLQPAQQQRHGKQRHQQPQQQQQQRLAWWRRLLHVQRAGPDEQQEQQRQPARPPVVHLQHGLLGSATDWALNGPGLSLPFLLADAGFDVWLGNVRGNIFSRNHTTLDLQDAEFWSFSWDDMAGRDLLAMLMHELLASGAASLSYVGHSQGTTIGLAFLAAHAGSALAERIERAILLAPVAFVTHVDSVPLLTLASLNTDQVFALLGIQEFMPSSEVLSKLEGQLCRLQPALCVNLLAAICGYNPSNLDVARLPIYLNYTPSGTSVKNMAHWSQAVRQASPAVMSRYDYGTSCRTLLDTPRPCNQAVYGTATPPAYNLSAIATRLVLFTGGQDRLADPADVELLLQALPAGAERHHEPSYEHLDFIWGANAKYRVYARVLDELQRGGAGVSGSRQRYSVHVTVT